MTPLAVAQITEGFGLVLIALLLTGWLLAGSARLRAVCALLVLVAAPLVLAGSVIGDETSSLPNLSAVKLLVAAAGGLVVLAAVAALFVRFPRVVLPLALATVAFRVPLIVGGDSVRLLLPLYLTIAGAVVAQVWSTWRSDTAAPVQTPKLLDVTIVVYLVLYALQSLYAQDIATAVQNFCFFYAPFALLYGIVARQPWDARMLRSCLATIAGVALVLVLAGFVEFARQRYLITLGGTSGSDFDPYFRVQSLFFDPNIYGRFLAVVMLAVTAVMLWTARVRRVAAAGLLLALLWAGLVLSLSQSSFVALLAGLLVLAALRWNTRRTLALAGVVVVVAAGFALALPSVVGIDFGSGAKAESTTSGRFDLVTGAFTLAGQRPLHGHGSGDFSRAFKQHDLAQHTPFGPARTTKSHTTPLTVLAEQGVIGLAAFIALLIAAFGAVFRRTRPGDGPRERPGLVARVAVAAAFTAVFVHTLFYAAFLEDPLVWLLLGCAVSLAAIPRSAAEAGEGEPAASTEAPT